MQMTFRCHGVISARFVARLTRDTAHFVRTRVELWGDESLFANVQALGLYRLTPIDGNIRYPMNSEHVIRGLPITVGRFFAGLEHPLSEQQIRDGQVVGSILHASKLAEPTQDKPWAYGAVFGVASEESQLRRSFSQYIHEVRPGRRTPMVHYNSWYDFYSYQDEGFNGGDLDRRKNPELISALRLDKLREEGCLERVEAFGTELVLKRGTKMDSFLWDDGWDDPTTLWQFDKQRFPRRFHQIAAKAREYGAGTGVWLSPWGGYGIPQQQRIAYGKQLFGAETNSNAALQSEAFSLAGPRYRKVFVDTALAFRRQQGVNMYKFDGVAGDPSELAVEMEAMLDLILQLRVDTNKKDDDGGRGDDDDGQDGDDHGDDEVWINLTTGTWASPFFLLWADSIWRGAGDIQNDPREWLPDPPLSTDGLSRRQRWIRWRSMVVHELVVRRSGFFPISQLMIHGVIVASHGDALMQGLNKYDQVDFAQEVWSFVGLGLQLQELYVAPRYMTDQAWDVLAEGLKWARREAYVLLDSHWAFGEARLREVSCVASWHEEEARGFIYFYNPLGTRQTSKGFTLASVLELPSSQKGMVLELSIVASVARPDGWTEEAGDADSKVHSRTLLPPGCTNTKSRFNEPSATRCTTFGLQLLVLELLPTEVLVLQVDRALVRDVQ